MKLKTLLLLVISLVLFAGCNGSITPPQCDVTPSTQEECDKMGENSCLKFKLEGEGCAARCVIDNDASKACPDAAACAKKAAPATEPCQKYKLDYKFEDGKVTATCVEDPDATAACQNPVAPITQDTCNKLGEDSCIKYKLEGTGADAKCVIDATASQNCPDAAACAAKTDSSNSCQKFKLDFKIEGGKAKVECVEDTAATTACQNPVAPITQATCDKLGEDSCIKYKLEGSGADAKCIIDEMKSKACPDAAACAAKTDSSDSCQKFKLDFKIEGGKAKVECVEDPDATAAAKQKDPTTPNQCCPDPMLYSTEDADCPAAQPKTANIGEKCTTDTECGGGTCITAGMDSSFKEGYCSVDCSRASGLCPADSTCKEIKVGSATKHQCLKNCSDSNNCREGYQCSDSVCVPSCTKNSDCASGEICDTTNTMHAQCVKAKNIGDECSKDDDCNGVVSGAVCLIYDNSDSKKPKGTCTVPCRSFTDCRDQTNRTEPGDGFRCEPSVKSTYNDPQTYCFPTCNDPNGQKDDAKCTTFKSNLSCVQTAASVLNQYTDYICRPPIAGVEIGKACYEDSQCGGYYCDIFLPGGSCEASLLDKDGKTGQCPTGTKNIEGECKKTCAQNRDCRESDGYTCDMTNGVCEAPNPFDNGTPPFRYYGQVGRQCELDEDCNKRRGQNDTTEYTCLKDNQLAPHGYCTAKTCTDLAPNATPTLAEQQQACPGTSLCTQLPVLPQGLNVCAAPCPIVADPHSLIDYGTEFCKAQMNRDDVKCQEVDASTHLGVCLLTTIPNH